MNASPTQREAGSILSLVLLPSVLDLLLLVVALSTTTASVVDPVAFQCTTTSSPTTSSLRPRRQIDRRPHPCPSSSRRDHRRPPPWKFPYPSSTSTSTSTSTSHLHAAPEGAFSDIVVHSVFDFYSDIKTSKDEKEDPRVWVPQSDRLSFRPLCLCTSQGYYVNLLKFTGGGGTLGRHRHSSPVHALTLKGTWGYEEHEWRANAGTYVYEPPGETHTLIVDDDCDEMITLFHVTGSLLYVSGGGGGTPGTEEEEVVIGYDDVFTKLEKARRWYEKCGLGRDFADRLIR